MIKEIAYVGTPVTDMKRARAFYEGALGLKPTLEAGGGMWVEYDIGAGTLALGCFGKDWKPSSDGTCIGLEVDDVAAELARLKAQGVPVQMELTETPVCWFATVSDPDGSKVMLHKRKAK